jgi:zinc/manganese transport system substrate-binding protein
MPRVAAAVAGALGRAEPDHASYFRANAAAFDRSLDPWNRAIASLRSSFPGAPVAVTEPVADDLIQAAGLHNQTPWTFQADVMNGVDPSPQEVTLEETLLRQRHVDAFLFNQQVTDSVTETLLGIARQSGVPVVGVYETMPAGYDYQGWMVAQTLAIQKALADHTSTVAL